MRRLSIAVIVLALAGAAGYFTYSLAYPTYVYRFKITIEVETKDGVKTGSSVLETRTVQYPDWPSFIPSNAHATVRGEAVFVDLGNGRNLVALLSLGPHIKNSNAFTFAPRSYFDISFGAPKRVHWAREMLKLDGDRRVFAGDMRPTLVTFSNLNDSTSVREVPFDSPADVLGSDVRQVRSWIEITNDPVTWSLEKRIPWIRDFATADQARKIVTLGRPTGVGPIAIFIRPHH